MELLSNDALIYSYFRAIELRLEQNFIDLLLAEIKRRGLDDEIDEFKLKKNSP